MDTKIKQDLFLKKCYQNKEIDSDYYAMLNEDVTLLKSCINILPIAENLEVAKEHFNNCLPVLKKMKEIVLSV